MSFCLGYLHPQFKQKDERMRLIRQKGIYISYFASLVYYIILTVVIQLNFVTLTALQVLNILAALTIITVPIMGCFIENLLMLKWPKTC